MIHEPATDLRVDQFQTRRARTTLPADLDLDDVRVPLKFELDGLPAALEEAITISTIQLQTISGVS